MATKEQQNTLKRAEQALDRIQQFDVKTLAREQELGSTLNFQEAVRPATRIIDL